MLQILWPCICSLTVWFRMFAFACICLIFLYVSTVALTSCTFAYASYWVVREKLQQWWENWAVCDSGTDYAEIPPDCKALLVHVKEIKKKKIKELECVRETGRQRERETIPVLWVTLLRETRTPTSLQPPHLSIACTYTHTHIAPLLSSLFKEKAFPGQDREESFRE